MFILDIFLYMIHTGFQINRYQTDRLFDFPSVVEIISYTLYAFLLLLWMIYFLYLLKYFWGMAETYQILLQLEKNKARCLTCVRILVIIASTIGLLNFFIVNTFFAIWACFYWDSLDNLIDDNYNLSNTIFIAQEVLGWFQNSVPFILGIFLIYLIQFISQILKQNELDTESAQDEQDSDNKDSS